MRGGFIVALWLALGRSEGAVSLFKRSSGLTSSFRGADLTDADADTLGGPYVLPELGFPYEALENSFVGSQTMHFHHDKHHAFYVSMLNKAVAQGNVDAPHDVKELVSHIRDMPPEIQTMVRNHGGGHLNHALLWQWLRPGKLRQPAEGLGAQIVADFGSVAAFQSVFEQAGVGRFGSGWSWLIFGSDGKLRVCSTANQDNPVMDVEIGDCHGTPLLGLDVWEHAYYLDYQNLRLKYMKAFWKVANWEVAEELYREAKAHPPRPVHSGAFRQFGVPHAMMLAGAAWAITF